MTGRTQDIPDILGPALQHFWEGGVTSPGLVTVLQDETEIEECGPAEVVILAPGGSLHHCALRAVELLAGEQVAAVLMPASLAPGDAPARLGALSQRYGLTIGLLESSSDPRAVANTLTRALLPGREQVVPGALREAETLGALAEALGRLVGNAVSINAPDHESLAYSSTYGDVDRVREESILRRRGIPRVLRWQEQQGYLAQIFQATRPLRIPGNPELNFRGRVAMPVRAAGTVLAVIWVMETARSLGQPDFTVIEQAAHAASTILLRQQVATQREADLRVRLLDDVIHGRIAEAESIRALAGSLGWNVDRLRQAMVAAIDTMEGNGAIPPEWQVQQARARLIELVRLHTGVVDPEAVIGPRATDVVILFHTDTGSEAANKRDTLLLAQRIVDRIATLMPNVTATVGVGSEQPSFDRISESFRQAEAAVRLGMWLRGGNMALHVDDLGIDRGLLEVEDRKIVVTPHLGRIIAYDQSHQTDWIRSLACYLTCFGNLSEAAMRLGVHRNSLRYRLERIQALAGVHLGDPDTRLTLTVGLRVLALEGNTEAARGLFLPPGHSGRQQRRTSDIVSTPPALARAGGGLRSPGSLRLLCQLMEDMPDRRGRQGKVHALAPALTMSVAAMLAGATTIGAIERWAATHGNTLYEAIGASEQSLPGLSTLRRMFMNVDVPAFELILTRWLEVQGIPSAGVPASPSPGGGLPGSRLLSTYAADQTKL